MNDQALYEIYDVVHVPFWQAPWFHITCGTISACLFVFVSTVAFLYITRKKKKNELPWEVALSQLSLLKQQPMIVAQDHKFFYCTLTNIMKKYFSDRYQFNVLPKTDAEFIAAISHKNNISIDVVTKLNSIFVDISLVKFANKLALQNKAMRDVEDGIAIIVETIPVQSEQGKRAS